MEELWEMVVQRLSGSLSETAIRTWFSDCTLLAFDTNKITLRAGSDFKKAVIQRQFVCLLQGVLRELFGGDFEICVLNEAEARCFAEAEARKPCPLIDGSRYRFDNFIDGPSNRLAFYAAKKAAECDDTPFNPMMIYGDSGLGKTHLLYAIANAVRERKPDTNIVFIKGDEFVNRLVKAIKDGTTEEFRTEFRSAELLLVDDVHMMAGKRATQEEFFCTFNAVYEAGHTIVMTSDSPPEALATLEDRLRTRFEGGLLADIQPLDPQTRQSILRIEITKADLALSAEEMQLLEQAQFSNVRQIEGALKSLRAFGEILGRHPDGEQLKTILKNVGAAETGANFESILRETARFFDLAEDDIRGQARSTVVSNARHTAMYLMRRLLDMRLSEIGRELGGRNHATVLSAVRKTEALLETDDEYRAAVESIAVNAGGSL